MSLIIYIRCSRSLRFLESRNNYDGKVNTYLEKGRGAAAPPSPPHCSYGPAVPDIKKKWTSPWPCKLLATRQPWLPTRMVLFLIPVLKMREIGNTFLTLADLYPFQWEYSLLWSDLYPFWWEYPSPCLYVHHALSICHIALINPLLYLDSFVHPTIPRWSLGTQSPNADMSSAI